MPTTPTDPADRTPDPLYVAAQIAGDERHAGDDGHAARSVTRWILAEMVDSLLMLAFANACDEMDEVKMPHPCKPGMGGNFADHWRDAEPDATVVADAERTAAELFACILKHYDPAPALLRWLAADPKRCVSRHWYEQGGHGYDEKAAARCWGHYAVMEALGHGVAWSDDNAPLTGPRYAARQVNGDEWCVWSLRDGMPYEDAESEDEATYKTEKMNEEEGPVDLAPVGDLDGCNISDVVWSDAYTRAVYAKLDAATDAPHDGGAS